MNIGMILEYPYPFDIRIRKESDALLKAGYKVFLMARNKGDQPEFEVVDGITVFRYHYHETKYMGGRSVQFVFTFKDRQWIKYIKKFILKYDIHVLHIHDLPMVYSALTADKDFQLPVVFDREGGARTVPGLQLYCNILILFTKISTRSKAT